MTFLHDISCSPPPPLHESAHDLWVWNDSPSGKYTVQSAYKFLSQEDDTVATWNWLWHVSIPEKIGLFLWLISHAALLVNFLRFRRQLATNPLCFLCGTESENWYHCLLYCGWVRQLWKTLHVTVPVDCAQIPQSDLNGFLLGMYNVYGPIFVAALWIIWLERNARIFRGKSKPLWALQRDIFQLVNDMECCQPHSSARICVGRLVHWNMRGAIGTILHVNSSSMGNPGRSGYGFVVRDDVGNWLGGGYGHLGHKSITYTEVVAIAEGLDFVARMGVQCVCCYSDSTTALGLLDNRDHYHPLAALLLRIHTLRHAFDACEFLCFS